MVFYCSGIPQDQHSFPTRRSSDLVVDEELALVVPRLVGGDADTVPRREDVDDVLERLRRDAVRSEEHTSELQSHVNLVCRLLLEKKNLSIRSIGILSPHPDPFSCS